MTPVDAARLNYVAGAYLARELVRAGRWSSVNWLALDAASIQLDNAVAAASDARRMAREGRAS